MDIPKIRLMFPIPIVEKLSVLSLDNYDNFSPKAALNLFLYHVNLFEALRILKFYRQVALNRCKKKLVLGTCYSVMEIYKGAIF